MDQRGKHTKKVEYILNWMKSLKIQHIRICGIHVTNCLKGENMCL